MFYSNWEKSSKFIFGPRQTAPVLPRAPTLGEVGVTILCSLLGRKVNFHFHFFSYLPHNFLSYLVENCFDIAKLPITSDTVRLRKLCREQRPRPLGEAGVTIPCSLGSPRRASQIRLLLHHFQLLFERTPQIHNQHCFHP